MAYTALALAVLGVVGLLNLAPRVAASDGSDLIIVALFLYVPALIALLIAAVRWRSLTTDGTVADRSLLGSSVLVLAIYCAWVTSILWALLRNGV